MVRRAQPPLPAEFAMLGLIAVRPRHGYELAEIFSAVGEVGGICRLNMSMLYAHLKRLEVLGYIDGTLVAQGNRPPKTVHHATPAGEAALRAWLDEPVRHNRDIRLEFLLKLFTSRQVPGHDTAGLLGRQLVMARGWVAALQRDAEVHPRGSFERMVREMRLAATQATVDWLEGCLATVPVPVGV